MIINEVVVNKLNSPSYYVFFDEDFAMPKVHSSITHSELILYNIKCQSNKQNRLCSTRDELQLFPTWYLFDRKVRGTSNGVETGMHVSITQQYFCTLVFVTVR